MQTEFYSKWIFKLIIKSHFLSCRMYFCVHKSDPALPLRRRDFILIRNSLMFLSYF